MRCGDFGDFVCGAPAVERQKDRESVGKPLRQCHRHRWAHRAKTTEQHMLLVSQLAQLLPRFVQLHRRACVQRVHLQLSVEADKLKHKFFGYHCTAGLRGTLREFTDFQVVHFLFTFSNRCELVFPLRTRVSGCYPSSYCSYTS